MDGIEQFFANQVGCCERRSVREFDGIGRAQGGREMPLGVLEALLAKEEDIVLWSGSKMSARIASLDKERGGEKREGGGEKWRIRIKRERQAGHARLALNLSVGGESSA